MPSVKQEVGNQKSEVSGQSSDCCSAPTSADLTTDLRPLTSGREYWRSLDELLNTEEFQQRIQNEFPAGAAEMLSGSDRRSFLKAMGASLALAGIGLAGCRRWPEEKIAPFARRPDDRTPGEPEHYATAMEIGGVAAGLLITSFDGRPVKIEGNPEHPITRGSTDAIMQASVLGLYDPDRSRHPVETVNSDDGDQRQRRTIDEFRSWAKNHFGAMKNAGGSGLAILSEASASPSLMDMKARLLRDMPRAQWFEYEPLANDSERKGSQLAFGSPHRTHLALDKAKVIVALDSDFLWTHPAAVKHARDFADSRRLKSPKDSMSRLYAFEGAMSLTGANADHRFAVRSADVAIIAARLASQICGDLPAPALGALRKFADVVPAGWDAGKLSKALVAIEQDLQNAGSSAVIVAGPRQPAEVHLLVHLMNAALGTTVTYTPEPEGPSHLDSIRSLASQIDSGSVETLVILGGNPVYNAPADLDFASKLKQVRTIVHLSDYPDETSQLSAQDNSETRFIVTWHVNRSHFLESWGDGRAWDGTYSIVQPLIEPLFNGISPIELLGVIIDDELKNGYDIVRRSFQEMTGASAFEPLWRKTLHDGLLAGSTTNATTPRLRADNAAGHLNRLHERWSTSASSGSGPFELVFLQDNRIHDGRFANNGWLQELPDPLTKITWDNVLLISPGAATKLGVKQGDLVSIVAGAGQRRMQAAVALMPGMHDQCAAIALGGGREMDCHIAAGAGFNAYPLRTADTMGFAGGVNIQKAEGTLVLAATHDHHAIDVNTVPGAGAQERLPTLIREGTLHEYHDHPDFAKHRTHVVHRLSMFDEGYAFQTGDGDITADHAWAMSIDLNACIGCGACVVACQAENNIPVVGKDQVQRGREMHWIRIDRYFKFAKANGAYDVNQLTNFAIAPVPCMHCENAPCEQVCPVAATVHDDDGLNVMVYNRCIGTRYCSNNCPYKVRRFNYFDYQVRKPVRDGHGLMHVDPSYYTTEQSGTEPLKRLQHNPEVTVRSRGVMEKCTYCVQRLAAAKIRAKNKFVRTAPSQRPARIIIEDSQVTPACAQACPAKAIVFGDLKNPDSAVVKAQRDSRSYQMLEEINTKARTQYLAKVRNPNSNLTTESH